MKQRPDLSDSRHSQASRPAANPRRKGKTDSRGVALVITLLLLFLMSALGLAAVLTSSSDLMINGYYGNYRGSFYAADSGLNVARQSMQATILSLVANGTTWQTTWTTCSNGPITVNQSSSTNVSWTNPYSSSTALTGSSATNPAAVQNSWSESFYIKQTQLNSSAVPYITIPAVSAGGCNATVTPPSYTYTFNYSLTSVGTASGQEQASVTENGSFVLNISTVGGTTPKNTSFSAFGAFIDSFPPCDGPLVYGTITGPLYADATTGCPSGTPTQSDGKEHCGEWNLGSGGSYTFTYPVNETGSMFSYYPGNQCTQSSSVPFTSGHTTISPTFQAGYNFSQSITPLPQDSFSQLWAVLDGLGCGENNGNQCGNVSTPSPIAPTAEQMNNYSMQNVDQHNTAADPYATQSGSTYTAPTSGVYMPYTCSSGTCSLTSTAGGIYVEDTSGEATTVTLTAATSSMYSSSTFPTSSQCTAAACQVIQVAQTGSSTTGNPVVTEGSTSCSGGTCSANFTETVATGTPTTITNITIDPSTDLTTAQTYVQTSTSTTSQTVSNSCHYSSPAHSCTVSQPTFGSCSGWDSDCSTNTTVANGTGTDLTLSGVPTMSTSLATPSNSSCTAVGGSCAETMLYVDGSIDITGPSSGAAMQNNSMLSVVANGNIQQTGNLLYATEPVSTSGSSLDALNSLSANASYQVLGLFTANGEFQLSPSSSGGNLETDAAIAVISGSSTCTPSNNCGMIATPNNGVGTWTNIGGRSEDSINSVSIQTGNVYYDQRFAQYKGFSPPWFPQTTIATKDLTQTQTTTEYPTVQRVQWYSSTSGQ